MDVLTCCEVCERGERWTNREKIGKIEKRTLKEIKNRETIDKREMIKTDRWWKYESTK